MTKPPLDLKRFVVLVAAYGSKSERWPEGERERAQALLLSSEEARALVAREAGLDGLLASAELEPASPALLRRLNELPARLPHATGRSAFRVGWATAFGWALAAGFGVLWGVRSEALDPTPVAEETAVDATYASTTTEDDESMELALGSVADFGEEP